MPHRYYDYVDITFVDGATERIGGNRERVEEGVLSIWTDSNGFIEDMVKFPLCSIRSWRWEKGE